jgi:hypothetical protein
MHTIPGRTPLGRVIPTEASAPIAVFASPREPLGIHEGRDIERLLREGA